MAERVVAVSLIARINSYLSDMEQVKRKNREVGESADEAAQRFEQQNQAMEKVGTSLMVGGAIATAATALAVKAAIDWESAWAGVTKTVDGTPEQLAEVEAGLRGLAKELPATHQELAAVAEAAGQLGVARDDVVDFTEIMVQLGMTTNLSADEAATSIAQLMNVMQTAPDQVDNLGAALVALGNDGASTERDIIQMAQRIAGAGKTIGLSEGEVLGFANALASVGIEAEAGGSAISRIMTDIAMSVSAGGDELTKFATVAGMSAADFSAAFKEDPADAIATFIEGLGRVNESGGDVFATLSDLGQSDIRVSQALLGMANSGDLLRKSLDLGNASLEENTALQEEAEKRIATTEAQLQILGNTINDAAIDFGQVFLPAVNGAAQAIGDFASFLGDLPPELQEGLSLATGIGGAIALAGGAALVAVPKIAAFKLALSTLGVTAGTTKGILLDTAKAAGVLAALALAHEIRGWASEFTGATKSAADFKKELTGPGGIKDVLDSFDTGENRFFGADMGGENIRNLTGDFKELYSFAADFQNSWAGTAAEIATFGLIDTSLGRAKDNAKELDAALSQLVAEGNGQAAAAYVEAAADSAGTSVERLLSQLPLYSDAQRGVTAATEEGIPVTLSASEAYLDAAGGASDLAAQLDALIGAIDEANGVGQDAVSANAAFQGALEGISSEVQRQKDAFEEANGTLAGFTLSMDESTAAGSSNAAMLSDVAGKAQSSAKAQYDLDLQTMSAKDATDKYVATLATSKTNLEDAAKAAGFNADEVQKLTDKVYAVPDEKATKLLVESAAATAKLDEHIRKLNSIPGYKETIINEVIKQTGAPRGQVGAAYDGNANGGVHAFANGGEGLYTGGRPLYRFAEYETGFETFVSGKRGRERENLGYAVDAIRRLGHQSPQAARDVFGRSSSTPVAAPRPIELHMHNPIAKDPVRAAQEAADLIGAMANV